MIPTAMQISHSEHSVNIRRGNDNHIGASPFLVKDYKTDITETVG